MNQTKKGYVDYIRANSAYPTYRGVISIITAILMILAGLQALGALVLGLTAMKQAGFLVGVMVLLMGAAFAALAFFMARFWNEAAQILADIGDSVMETNARSSGA
jgi:ATP/ADP translocase